MWPFSPELKGNITIKLTDLKIKSKIKDSFKMQLESKRITPEYEIELQIREPITEKEYLLKTRNVLKIVKTYPPFEIEKEISKESKEINNQSSHKPKEEEALLNKNKENNIVNIKKEGEKKESLISIKNETKEKEKEKENQQTKISPSEFNQEDIKDPENIENLNTLKQLEYVLLKVEKKISQVEGRPPMELRQSKMKLSVKKKMIEERINDGSIQLKDYLTIVVNQIEKNRRLVKYFEQEGMNENKEKSEVLLKVLNGEYEEGKKYLNNGNK